MIEALVQKIKNQETSAAQVVEQFLQVIKEKDKDIRAFLVVFEDEALAQARRIDEALQAGQDLGPLAGVPVAVKDNILVAGHKTTAASLILADYIASYDAYVVERLKQAGAVVIGKTNLDEFAQGSSTENSAFFATKNPYDLSRVPGGSSGGSAAAVAAGMVPLALGSDTGGSIRQPAAFCGVVGFKPTYGSVSRRGLIAMTSSMDQIGPLSHSVTDCKLAFSVISGQDKLDATSFSLPFHSKDKNEFKNLKIGLPQEFFEAKQLDKDVKAIILNQIETLKKAGFKFQPVSLSLATKTALAAYYVITPAEISSNLARYDGVKYGLARPAKTYLERYFKNRGAGFGAEPKRRILLGTYVLSAGYKERYYHQAQAVRIRIKQEFQEVFHRVDFILTPTTPHPAFALGQKIDDPVEMYLEDLFVVSANLAGLPAISLPAGWVGHLPVGMQLMGPQRSDWDLLNLAESIEGCLRQFSI